MNFDDDDFPFDMNELNKIFKQLQHTIMKALQDQGIDISNFDLSNMDLSNLSNLSNFDLSAIPGLSNFMQMSPEEVQDILQNNPNIRKMGFTISFGPDGQPDIQPLNNQPQPFTRQDKSGFEEPFTDVFYTEETYTYQIIVEVQGVENPDHVHLRVKDKDLLIHAETGPFKYRKNLPLEYPIDEKTLHYTLNNGILEITAKAILKVQ